MCAVVDPSTSSFLPWLRKLFGRPFALVQLVQYPSGGGNPLLFSCFLSSCIVDCCQRSCHQAVNSIAYCASVFSVLSRWPVDSWTPQVSSSMTIRPRVVSHSYVGTKNVLSVVKVALRTSARCWFHSCTLLNPSNSPNLYVYLWWCDVSRQNRWHSWWRVRHVTLRSIQKLMKPNPPVSVVSNRVHPCGRSI